MSSPTHKPGKQVRKYDDLTMVVHTGQVAKTLKELELDLRNMLLPYVFDKIKVSNKNTLRDFTEAAHALEATMIILLRSQKEKAVFSLCRRKPGLTLHFNIISYSLCSDIREGENYAFVNKQSHGKTVPILYGFSSSKEDQALALMFKNLFPAVDDEDEDIKMLRRCVLFHKGDDNIIRIRHFGIQLRKNEAYVMLGKNPDLGQYESIEEFFLKHQDKNDKHKNLKPLKLLEIGPRIDLKLDAMELGIFSSLIQKDSNKGPKRAEEE